MRNQSGGACWLSLNEIRFCGSLLEGGLGRRVPPGGYTQVMKLALEQFQPPLLLVVEQAQGLVKAVSPGGAAAGHAHRFPRVVGEEKIHVD